MASVTEQIATVNQSIALATVGVTAIGGFVAAIEGLLRDRKAGPEEIRERLAVELERLRAQLGIVQAGQAAYWALPAASEETPAG